MLWNRKTCDASDKGTLIHGYRIRQVNMMNSGLATH